MFIEPLCRTVQSVENLILGTSAVLLSGIQTQLQVSGYVNPSGSMLITPFSNQYLSQLYAWSENYDNYATLLAAQGIDIRNLDQDVFRVGVFASGIVLATATGGISSGVYGAVTSYVGTGVLGTSIGVVAGVTASYTAFSLGNYVIQNTLASSLNLPPVSLYSAFCGEGGATGCLKQASFAMLPEATSLAIPRIANVAASIRIANQNVYEFIVRAQIVKFSDILSSDMGFIKMPESLVSLYKNTQTKALLEEVGYINGDVKIVSVQLTWNGQGTYSQFMSKYTSLKAASDAGLLIKTSNITRIQGLTDKYRNYLADKVIAKYGTVNPEMTQRLVTMINDKNNFNVDHIIELQLSGIDDFSNMRILDSSLNRSFGAQVRNALNGLPDGTIVIIE